MSCIIIPVSYVAIGCDRGCDAFEIAVAYYAVEHFPDFSLLAVSQLCSGVQS